ncbi:MAG: hypothetical protein ACK5WQ_07700, partial [Alphaproteobacteria bacterium]
MLEITAPIAAEHQFLLTPEARAFVSALVERFEPRRKALLANRV